MLKKIKNIDPMTKSLVIHLGAIAVVNVAFAVAARKLNK